MKEIEDWFDLQEVWCSMITSCKSKSARRCNAGGSGNGSGSCLYPNLQARTSSVPPVRASEELAVESIKDEIIWLSYISLGQRLGYFISVP